MIKLIALDIDGTLTNDEKKITPATRDALIAVQKMGVIAVLASGRQAPGLLRESRELCMQDYHGLLLSYNGARIEDATTGEILYAKGIDNETAVSYLRHLAKLPVSAIVDDGEAIITTSADNFMIDVECRNNNMKLRIVPDIADAVDFAPSKILTAAPPSQLSGLLADIREGFEDKLSFAQSAPWFYEATAPGVSKAESLGMVCRKLGIAPCEVMAFGDAQNDLSMINFAGIGVAMGNSSEELKNAADEVTLSNNEDGIAATLKKYFSI